LEVKGVQNTLNIYITQEKSKKTVRIWNPGYLNGLFIEQSFFKPFSTNPPLK